MWQYVTPLIVAIVVYAAVGFFVNEAGLTLYNTIPASPIKESSIRFDLQLRNNAPITLPFVNALFSGGVMITNTTGNIDCELISGRGNIPCVGNTIDVGSVEAGKSGTINVIVTPDGKDFTLDLIGYVNFGIVTGKKEAFINCMHVQNSYVCS